MMKKILMVSMFAGFKGFTINGAVFRSQPKSIENSGHQEGTFSSLTSQGGDQHYGRGNEAGGIARQIGNRTGNQGSDGLYYLNETLKRCTVSEKMLSIDETIVIVETDEEQFEIGGVLGNLP